MIIFTIRFSSCSSAGKESTCSAGDPLGRWRRDRLPPPVLQGFPGGSAGKESTCNVEDLGLIPGSGRSPGEGKGYPLQYSDLKNSRDGIVHGVAKSRTWLSDFHIHIYSWAWYRRLCTLILLRVKWKFENNLNAQWELLKYNKLKCWHDSILHDHLKLHSQIIQIWDSVPYC